MRNKYKSRSTQTDLDSSTMPHAVAACSHAAGATSSQMTTNGLSWGWVGWLIKV